MGVTEGFSFVAIEQRSTTLVVLEMPGGTLARDDVVFETSRFTVATCLYAREMRLGSTLHVFLC